jgi:2'-5' RNA ligase
MDTMRLFFALWPSEDLSCALAREADILVRRFGGKPTRRETIHLTLAFLGELAITRLPAVIDAGHRVDAMPFDLVIDRLGGWRHNNLLWAGCAAPEGLRSLVTRLHEQLRAATIVFDAAPRFVPHLTLVRKARFTRADIDERFPQPLTWNCARFVLAHSRPATVGREYAILESFDLSASGDRKA